VYPGQDARRRTTLAYARWGDSVWERTVLGKGLRDMMKPPGLARQTTNGVKSMTTAGGAKKSTSGTTSLEEVKSWTAEVRMIGLDRGEMRRRQIKDECRDGP